MKQASGDYTAGEERNLQLAREYMEISYDPKRASARAVAHLCAPNNRFIAPSTFPDTHTLEQYAEHHGKLMKAVNDLHIVNFDALFAHEDRVAIRIRRKEHTPESLTETSSRRERKLGGPRPHYFESRVGSWSNLSRTGTSYRCGSSSAGRSKSV